MPSQALPQGRADRGALVNSFSLSMTWLVFRRVLMRHWRHAPGQNLLLVLILALGVGVFVSIRLANRAAVSSFENFTEALVGQSDWVIEAPVGTLPQSVLVEIRNELGPRPVDLVPVVEATAGIPAEPGSRSELDHQTMTLLGVDLVGISNLAPERGLSGSFVSGGPDFWRELQGGPRVWVGPGLAARSSLELDVGDRIVRLPVAGVIPTSIGAPAPPATLAIMDLPELQRLTGKVGRLDRVECIAAPGPSLAQRRIELGALLTRMGKEGRPWLVRDPGAKREVAEEMTQAFRLNLTVLSLVALLVGLYLIFQALDGAVVRRRGEIAILRSMGIDESVVRTAWMLEAAFLGFAGGILGLGAGWVGAQGAVRLVGRTVNALYFASTVRSASFSSSEACLAICLAVGTSIVAAWLPAREAAQVPPAQVLVRSATSAQGPSLWRSPWWATAVVGAGFLASRLPAIRLSGGVRFPLAGYGAALAWIIGAGMLCAATMPMVTRATRRLGSLSAGLRVAAGHLLRPSGRHRLAAAAVVCAIGMSAGMAILVASFELSVRNWVGQALQSDVYLYSAGSRSASAANPISPATWRAIASHRGVREAWVLSTYVLQLGGGQPTLLTGTDMAKVREHSSLPWIEQPRGGDVFDVQRNEGLALVSESFSDRFGLHRGDPLEIPMPSGSRRLTIAGVFSDYGNERGSVMVDRVHLVRWMGDDSATHLSLFAGPGVNPDALRAELRGEYPGFEIFTNRNLREEILKVFRQTFSITYALEVIGIIVAIAGIGLTMSSVLLDRRDELTTLRALGFSRTEIALGASAEGLAVALWAVVCGLLLSLGLGWLLIHVINKQSFGWTLGFSLPWLQLLSLGIAVACSGGVVSYAVGIWGTQLPADQEE